MGNAINFDINFDFGNKPSSGIWMWVSVVLLFSIVLFLLYRFFFSNRHNNPVGRRSRRNQSWFAPATSVFLIYAIIQCVESSYRPLVPQLKKPHRFTKSIRNAGNLVSPPFITAATYFGLDQIANFLREEPEMALSYICLGSAVFVLLFALLIREILCRLASKNVEPSRKLGPHFENQSQEYKDELAFLAEEKYRSAK